ncbi:hypothetical protein H9649_11515 [Sporosarcina sp. Sa2YVA2]|uniref:Uncharacterized protein n=1 Tax=Sporosarcina quadrami TaxID=2762234 RepID=A0ABR8UB10_9BACL|nr:hypothetical protein [Sporosarcina quadrami]MBD7985217.1 hypothetical protein [Sporosarcina quadrami]
MPLIPVKALPHFENMIYLPLLLTVLELDRAEIEKGTFKLKGPYLKIIDTAILRVQKELQETTFFLKRNNMKVIRKARDSMFTDYIFINSGFEDHRRYLNVRLRNRTEELLHLYFTNVGDSHQIASN